MGLMGIVLGSGFGRRKSGGENSTGSVSRSSRAYLPEFPRARRDPIGAEKDDHAILARFCVAPPIRLDFPAAHRRPLPRRNKARKVPAMSEPLTLTELDDEGVFRITMNRPVPLLERREPSNHRH